MSNEHDGNHILLLTGLHPCDQHSELTMHDFNQEFVIARVLKTGGLPVKGTLMPVLVRSAHLDDDVKSRLHRRHSCAQSTSFSLSGHRFTGKIVQIEYKHESALAEDAKDVEICMFMIECD